MVRESIVSSSCMSFLSKSIKEASFFCCLPFKWNAGAEEIQLGGPLRTKLTRFLAGTTAILPIIVACRLLCWILLEYDGSDKSTTMGFASVFGLGNFLYNALIAWHTQKYYKEYRSFVNGALEFFAAVPRELRIRGTGNAKNGCEFYLKVYRVFIHFSYLSYSAGILLKNPDRPSTIMSFFKNPKQQPFFWPVTAANSSLILFGTVILNYFCALNVIYVCALNTAIDGVRVRAGIEQGNMTKDVFRRFYRTAQVLQGVYNQLFGSWIIPAQHNVVTTVVVIAVYGTVAMEGHRSTYLFICIYQLSNLSFLCIRMGKLHEVSKELLESVKSSRGRRGQDEWFKKFHRSCKPIVVTHGHMYHVDRTLILTVLDTIVGNAVNILVTYG